MRPAIRCPRHGVPTRGRRFGSGGLRHHRGAIIIRTNRSRYPIVSDRNDRTLGEVDDHVAFAGMQADPDQDTGHPVLPSATLGVVCDLPDFRRVHIEAVQAFANLRLAVFPSSRCFGRQGRQKKKPERETDSEDGFHCEIISRVQPTETGAHNRNTQRKSQISSQIRRKQRGGAISLRQIDTVKAVPHRMH